MHKAIRVFHLIKGLGRGGAETLLKETVKCSSNERIHYGFGYFLPWKNALVSSMRENDTEVHCFNCRNPASILASAFQVAKFVQQWKADLIHCHLPLAGIVGRLAGRYSSIPVIYTEHNLMERYHPLTRFVNLITWSLQKRVIAVSHEVSTSIARHTKNSVPVQVVQNGIPVHTFLSCEKDRVQIRNQWGIPEHAPVIGTVSVFRVQKDLPNWLNAAKILNLRHPESHFLIVGDGPLRKEIEDKATQLNLNPVLHFAGLQENVSAYYSAMDVFLSSSIFEGLPLTTLEAMAMKLPVVATAVGGVPEVVIEGKTGFLGPPKSPEFLADRVSVLLNSVEMRKRFGEEARRIVEERYSTQRMLSELETIYMQVVNGN